MILVKPKAEIVNISPTDLRLIERAGRVCYKSDVRSDVDPRSASSDFVKKRALESGHESMLEHSIMSVHIVCDRGVSHEIVRHRQTHLDDDMLVNDLEWNPGVSQESTRYCNYGKSGQVTFVIPPWVNVETGVYNESDVGSLERNNSFYGLCDYFWIRACLQAEHSYLSLMENGWKAQQARDVLPVSTKTEIFLSANWREWRHFLTLRCARDAHPQMREVAIAILIEARNKVSAIFDDIEYSWE